MARRCRTGSTLATAVERNPQGEDRAVAWRLSGPEIVQRHVPFELEAFCREEADVPAVLGNALGEGLRARGARILGEHLLLPRQFERRCEVEGVAPGRLDRELPQLHRRLRGLDFGGLLPRFRAGLPQLALSRGTKDSRQRASWADEPPRAAPSSGPLIELAAACLHPSLPTTTHRQRRSHSLARTTARDGGTQLMDGWMDGWMDGQMDR